MQRRWPKSGHSPICFMRIWVGSYCNIGSERKRVLSRTRGSRQTVDEQTAQKDDEAEIKEPTSPDQPGNATKVNAKGQADVETGTASKLSGLDETYSQQAYQSYHINAVVLEYAIKHGHLSARAVPKNEIEDRSKFDWFARLIIILQLTQFFINVMARAIEDLPIAPAEVAVSAFAVCSMTAYAIIWAKPKDATTTIVLRTYEAEEVPKIFQEYVGRHMNGQCILDTGDQFPSIGLKKVKGPPLPTAELRLESYLDNMLCIGAGAGIGTLFSAIHLAGWNLDFPSVADTWLWRGFIYSYNRRPWVHHARYRGV